MAKRKVKRESAAVDDGGATTVPGPPRLGGADDPVKADGRGHTRQVSRVRHVPLPQFFAYYVLIVSSALALAWWVPLVREALISPVNVPALDQIGGGPGGELPRPAPETFRTPYDRGLITLIGIAGALALSMPVAWVAMYTRRLRFDRSLVHSIIVLPVVVAPIVILVKNSLALAFSLAGIVAVVRFRNTLREPQDAVYIFLVLGIGLAAGVQALDVALVVSFCFNLLVLMLWKYDLGGLYSAGHAGVLTIGDEELLPLRGARESRRVRAEAEKLAETMETDGYLFVVAADAAAARRCLEITLTELATDWRIGEPTTMGKGLVSFIAAVFLRGRSSPMELLGELDERWPDQIAAAEYIPLRVDEE